MPKIIKIFISLVFLTMLSSLSVSKGQEIVNPDSALQTILNKLQGEKLSLAQAQEYAAKNSTSLKQAEAGYLASRIARNLFSVHWLPR